MDACWRRWVRGWDRDQKHDGRIDKCEGREKDRLGRKWMREIKRWGKGIDGGGGINWRRRRYGKRERGIGPDSDGGK